MFGLLIKFSYAIMVVVVFTRPLPKVGELKFLENPAVGAIQGQDQWSDKEMIKQKWRARKA